MHWMLAIAAATPLTHAWSSGVDARSNKSNQTVWAAAFRELRS